MTLWVAAIGLIGALAGGWGGQWIGGRMNEKRDHRDRDHEKWAYWRSERLEAYSDFFDAIDRWGVFEARAATIIFNCVAQEKLQDHPERQELIDGMREGQKMASSALAKI